MSLPPFIRPYRHACWLACVLLLGYVVSVHADPKPLSKEEQAKVDKAIDKGVAYLKRIQDEEGNWPGGVGKANWSLGVCLLTAYALLESGVLPDDSVIKKAAAYSRARLLETNKTYELSLGVLFLDRLGDPEDKKLLRSLALRLIAGQQRSGGWKYLCPRVKQEDEETLLRLLGEVDKLAERGEKPSAKWLQNLNVPRAFRKLTVFHVSGRLLLSRDPTIVQRIKVSEEESLAYWNDGRTDNSNTQFAMLALWVARRHTLIPRSTLDLLVLRFKHSQGGDGDWAYEYMIPRDSHGFNGEWQTMTCVGLLALAITHELEGSSTAKSPLDKSPVDRRDPPAEGRKSPPLGRAAAEAKDTTRVLKGLAYLYRCIGTPTGQMDERVPLPRGDYYFLWSLERVAMLYNLPTLADKEWYRWGAEILVTNQISNGRFGGTGWLRDATSLNTAFALLFLKHSHPMKDLTPKLPFKPEELNESIAHFVPKNKNKTLDRSTDSPSRRRELDRSITSPGQSRNPKPTGEADKP